MKLFLEGRKWMRENFDTSDSEEEKIDKERKIQAEVKGLRAKLERFEIEKRLEDLKLDSPFTGAVKKPIAILTKKIDLSEYKLTVND